MRLRADQERTKPKQGKRSGTDRTQKKNIKKIRGGVLVCIDVLEEIKRDPRTKSPERFQGIKSIFIGGGGVIFTPGGVNFSTKERKLQRKKIIYYYLL